MFAFAGQALATATLVVAAIVSLNLVQSPHQAGSPGTSPSMASVSPSPAVSPGATPSLPMGELTSGRYAWPWEGGEVRFTVGDGWTSFTEGLTRWAGTPRDYGIGPNLPGTPGEVTHVYSDACGPNGRLVPVGPTAEDLVTALESQGGVAVDTIGVPRRRAGDLNWIVEGWRLEISEPPDLDRAACRHGADGPLQIWADAAETSWYALAPGYRGVVYVFDLDGRRLVFSGVLGPEATEQAAMDLDDLVSGLEYDPPADGALPALDLPGTRSSPAGEYGWEGGPGSRAGMHKVVAEGAGGRETTALIFTVGPDCLAPGDGQDRVPVRVAGLEGLSVESFQPPVTFGSPKGDEITRAHALAVDDRTLCAFVTWHAATTAEELAAAEAVLDTLRAAPMGEDRVRIMFTLDEGWDVG